MQVFDSTHAKEEYFSHAFHAGMLCCLFLLGAIGGLVHTICPWVLPDFMSRMNAKISLKLNLKLCECPE